MTDSTLKDANSGGGAPRATKAIGSLYIVLVLAAAFGGYLYTVRSEGIFSCPGAGYGPDRYLAYCHAKQYGDYDHGAFWFALEPGIRDYVEQAEVLFLGNSRVQFGFSDENTHRWMAAAPASYFLLGFAYWENYTFERALLGKMHARARVYVVNLDSFFDIQETEPAKAVMQNDDLLNHYRIKRLWQRPHAELCMKFKTLCGGNEAFFRSLKTGDYERYAGDTGKFVVSYDPGTDPAMVSAYLDRAKVFFATLPVDRNCILLTIVPYEKTKYGTARALAGELGMPLLAPQIEGLTTFDHSHLDAASAARWSEAFFETAGPAIRQCLDDGAAG